ncbi:transcription factor JunB isoform X2 [Microcaecilia unicolor]|uniref:Transcription factor JunB n=1 Tax=Microcaecilia unicolor TaxID=1415580 RepID=A0A6P7XQX0_9AMPH|nr:transcription factor jun-B isoform X2 [Microcaecilia unicolor]
MCTKMEQPFYHDDSFLSGYGRADPGLLKAQTMALNLAEPYRSLKSQLRSHQQATEGQEAVATGGFFPAQDGGGGALLKLASPELERLIIQNSNGVITTSPSPGQYFYPRGVTEEQEGFADGFVKALDDLHKLNHMAPPNVSIAAPSSSSGSSVFGAPLHPEPPPVYTNLTSYNTSTYPTATISYLPQGQVFKEEPQTVPEGLQSRDGSPPLSPINMEDQERIKVERKRQRNRLAATKCRKRKLERIARLEDKVKLLKSENSGLASTATLLRDQVAQLKQKVMSHVNKGCQLLLTSKMQQAF